MLSISEMAKLCGVSVRTLHYYDQIGLLCPKTATDSGYRRYGAADVERMQEILFYRELDFPLKEIRIILADPRYDKQEALARQRRLLELKRRRLDRLLALLDANLKGEQTMEFKEFDRTGYETVRRQYADEARQRWGDSDAWRQSQEREAARGPAEQAALVGKMNAIFQRFARLRGTSPASEEVQAALADWQAFITEHYYPCTDEILAGLGQMYAADERFQTNMDRFGAGTTDLIRAAIAARCGK